MKRLKIVWMGLALALMIGPLTAWLGAGARAQATVTASGQVKDYEGKPMPGVTLVLTLPTRGITVEMKTDKDGKFIQAGLVSGLYDIELRKDDQVIYRAKVRIGPGDKTQFDIDLQKLGGKEMLERKKKQEEERKKFESMKAHFDAGVAALTEFKQVDAQIRTAAADQKAALKEKSQTLAETATTELQSAEQAIGEKDPNRVIVLAKLGEAYDAAGKYQQAAEAYQKAIELKPTEAGYYNNLGNVLARTGKIDEAKAAYEKSATLDPIHAANAWRNLGIVLYNSYHLKEAVDPLRKAVELDKDNPQTWYLLGASLVGAMDYKQEGDKIIPVMQPGTVEAYQKCIELDPNGPWGAQAKEGLKQLQAMGLGIELSTKIKKKKK